MLSLKKVAMFVVLLTVVFSAQMAFAEIMSWDANADFSLASNPTGAWSYQWLTGLAPGQYGPMTTAETAFAGNPGLLAWDLGVGTIPLVVKNTDTTNTYYGWAPGVLGMHPGAGGNHAVVTWTAPYSGSFTFASTFTFVGSPAGNGVIPSLSKNISGAFESLGSQWIGPSATTWSVNSSTPLTLAAGETLSWALNPNTDPGGDSTVLSATVTAVPEPGTIGLLATGLFGLLAYAWRKRK